jgi:predicted PurR-regulated permease PerM
VQTAVTGRTWRRVAWILAGVVLIAAALWFASHIPRTISVFLIAAFIAFGVQPIVGRLERRMPKPLAVAIVFFGLLALIAIFLVIVVPLAISQTQLLAANIPAYAGTATGWMTEAQSSLQRLLPTLKLPTYGVNTGRIGATQTTSFISGAVASLGAIAINTATAFFIAFSSPRALPRCFPRASAKPPASLRPR